MHKVCKRRNEGGTGEGRGTERGLRYSDFALKYFRKNNYMHMPHKSGKNGTLFMTEDTKRVRQREIAWEGKRRKGSEWGNDHCTSFFAVFGNVRTRHTTQSQMARKLTKLVGVRVTPVVVVVVVAARGAAAREAHAMRQTKQNKTKQSGAEQS